MSSNTLTEEELLRCPACDRIYDDPVCLPCGHSLCAICLQALIDQDADTIMPDEIISCLVCVSNAAQPLAINHYPRNIALKKFCEYLTESATDSVASESEPMDGQATTEVIFCDEHDKQVIERFCLICRTLICATCEHSTEHKGHAVVSLNQGDNLTEVHRRVMQYCEEHINATRERLEINRANLDNIRNCVDSTDKAFRLLENNVISALREVFLRREKFFQRGYKDKENGCIEEGQILSTRLASTEVILRKLTSLSKVHHVKLSGIHHALFHLNAATPGCVGTVSENAAGLYSSKLATELNEVLDLCTECLIRMKSQFPGPKFRQEVTRNVTQSHNSPRTSSRSEKENAGARLLPVNGTQCQSSITDASSSPVSHDRPCFLEFLKKFPRNETDVVDEQNSAENNNIHEKSMANTVNLLTDQKTGEKYYVGLDEALDIANEVQPDTSMERVNNSTSESGDESLQEFQFLSTTSSYTSPSDRSRDLRHSDVFLNRTFGSRGKEHGQFNEPQGLAVNANSGNLYVADSYNNRIQVFSERLEFRFSFGKRGNSPGGLRMPLGVAVLPEASAVVVTDSYNNSLQFLSAENGEFLEKFGQKGSCAGCFDVPNSVAVNSKGHVIVTDTRNDRVCLITGTEGSYTFGTKGSGVLEFHHPLGVTVDEDDKIFVADYENNRIQVLSPVGEFLFTFGEKILSLPSNVAISHCGNIFVSDVGNKQVKIFDRKGNFLVGFGSEGTKSEVFHGPGAMAWLPDGQLVVGDTFFSMLRLFHCPY